MYCRNCGKELAAQAVVCPACGCRPYDGKKFCQVCGAESSPRAEFCARCGAELATPESVPNYLLHAIVITLCCCQPFGIIAIINSAQVNSNLASGDYYSAVQASRRARMWCWLGLGAGIAVWTVIGFLKFFSVVLQM